MNRYTFGARKRPVSEDEARNNIISLDNMLNQMGFSVANARGISRTYTDSGDTRVHIMSIVYGKGEKSMHCDLIIVDTPLELEECSLPQSIASYFKDLDYKLDGDFTGALEEYQGILRRIFSKISKKKH